MDIYIVSSYYHILISIVKTLINKRKAKLIIFNNKEKNNIAFDTEMINKIINYKLFEQVYVVGNPIITTFENKNLKFYFKKLIFIKFLYKKFTNLIRNGDNIYIFNDAVDLGQILSSKKIQYVLIEDGKDCFKNNMKFINQKMTVKNKIKKLLFGMYEMGSSKYIKYIEVNDKKEINVNNKKIVEVNRDQLFSKLSDSDIECLLDIFGVKNLFSEMRGTYNLLITQPFYKDKILSSKEKQIEMYEKIIKEYLNTKTTRIIIKIHPREENIYNNIPNIIVIDKAFPIELMNYKKNIRFDKVCTVSSTSIDSITNCNEKIKLTWNWLEDFKMKDFNE